MESPGAGKSSNTSLSFRYNANNEELEELFNLCDDDSLAAHCDVSPNLQAENASPKKTDKTSSILDKYFKSVKPESIDRSEIIKVDSVKTNEEVAFSSTPSKEVSSSPVKDYLNRLSKRSIANDAISEPRDGNETWKLFHDFKFKIAQAVVDIKTRSSEETKEKEKSVQRDNSISDSEEKDSVKDSDLSVGDTDNQVSSLESSIQNLSELSQPVTAKPLCDWENKDLSITAPNSDSSDNTHKNFETNEIDIPKEHDDSLEVESGVEAFEDTNMDGGSDIASIDFREAVKPDLNSTPTRKALTELTAIELDHPSADDLVKSNDPTNKQKFLLNYSIFFFTTVLFISLFFFPTWYSWNGFLIGLWLFNFMSSLKQWFLDVYCSDDDSDRYRLLKMKRNKCLPLIYTLPPVLEHKPAKKFEGWINHYRFAEYNPYTYNINKTTTAFIKLEGSTLRISYSATKVPKRAFWDEQLDKITFYQHRLYNLTGARVILLPKGLVRKRQWSKKYPICIILNENEKIEVLEKEAMGERKTTESVPVDKKKEITPEVETVETNTSPEKKKKFVWRKRDKSSSHPENEVGREGLRHRLARKMHRDKKTESVSTSTDFDNHQIEVTSTGADDLTTKSMTSTKAEELDIDEAEMVRIKQFLEEAELEQEGAGEGEWSIHVKDSRDSHSHLYLFGRTGRDKHEWFRRINLSINEANTLCSENSTSDDKSNSDAASEKETTTKDFATYKVSDKEVLINRTYSKQDSSTDPSIANSQQILLDIPDFLTYEKTFWPFLFKILQTHEMSQAQKVDKAVVCMLDPSSLNRNKSKKKKKLDAKNHPALCSCRGLPSEVTWVNTMIARFVFDAMRDPKLIAQVQNRIQRKLNIMKLPSFMSPLLITELSLAGACPLLEHISCPTWDERGIWIDADFKYEGGAYITVLTQINLMKLKKKNLTLEEQLMQTSERTAENENTNVSGSDISDQTLREKKPAIFDSDIEDSAESSTDEEESQPIQPVDSLDSHISTDLQGSTSEFVSSKKKFLRMVDRIATNKYFQTVTDYKVVKRAMEGISNTDIKLQIEIQGLEGRITLNVPSPPHDRVWVGFRTNPLLVLKARPAFGARTLRFAHVSNWIEQKLTREFEKFLVLPNMEDFTFDIMTPTPVDYE